MRLLWSQHTDAPLRGLVLARERNCALAWDAANWLYLFNARGERQAQVHLRGQVVGAACADDGQSFAAVSAEGKVWMLAPDLMPRWERSLGYPGLALVLASLGEQLAVADSSGSVQFFAADGMLSWKIPLPRPLRHLAFIPGKPLLVGCADFGLVACINAAGTVVWRDGLVAHTGSLACSDEGGLIAVACYGDGLWCYDLAGTKRQQPELAPCRLAALSYTGDMILTTGLEHSVRLFKRTGQLLETREVEGAPVALALTALGDVAWVGLAEGRIVALQVVPDR